MRKLKTKKQNIDLTYSFNKQLQPIFNNSPIYEIKITCPPKKKSKCILSGHSNIVGWGEASKLPDNLRYVIAQVNVLKWGIAPTKTVANTVYNLLLVLAYLRKSLLVL